MKLRFSNMNVREFVGLCLDADSLKVRVWDMSSKVDGVVYEGMASKMPKEICKMKFHSFDAMTEATDTLTITVYDD